MKSGGYTFSNGDIDRTAVMLQYRSVTEVRWELLAYGLSEVDAYFCYKAAQFLLAAGFYPRQGRP